MRTVIIAAAVITATAFFIDQGRAQATIGVTLDTGDRDEFGAAIGTYYRVPERDVIALRSRHMRDEEIPVVFYFANAARVQPLVIVGLRDDGLTWMDIALRFRLSPSLFYDPVYGRPYGYSRYRPGRVWGTIRYADDDFIRFCNVRFLSEQYHYRPENILHMRERQRDFFMIHNDIRREMERRSPKEQMQKRVDRHDAGRNTDPRNDKHGTTQDNSRNQDRHRPGRERE